jgi:transcriptional regulator with GAF, ATPase, and Fis domain
MLISRRFARFLFDYHNDAMFVLQWLPGVSALLGSLASRRSSAPPPPLYESGLMQPVRDAVGKVAPTGATVVLRGETGVGKELVARDIHESSLRRNRAFVKINCAALPSELLEAELFGYERGAFTGAEARKRGRFEHADGGTLLLDEITELPPELQPKLLHVLQDGEFFRIGGVQPIRCDVRVIAATNRDLESAVESGEFRQDLYYRLNVVEIRVPPLRERLEHIPGLVEYFQRRFAVEYGRPVAVSATTVELFRGYDWPGNVRELENMIRRIAVLGTDEHVADELRARVAGRAGLDGAVSVRSTDAEVRGLKEISRAAARDAERAVLLAALERSGWNRLHTAQVLGISYRSLLYKLAEHRLRPPARGAGGGSVA